MNAEFYQEKCPGCGAFIDSRDLNQLISHYNFNMNTGVYECAPVSIATNSNVDSLDSCLSEVINATVSGN